MFSQRIVNICNVLDEEKVACNSINVFKCGKDKFLKGRGLYKSVDLLSLFGVLKHLTVLCCDCDQGP